MSDALPPLYQPWLDELLGTHLDGEARATCGDCVMLPRAGRPAPPLAFDATVKCCTYHPTLPNFLVGRILAGEDSPARRHVLERLRARLWLSPRGIEKPPEYRLLYEVAARRPGVFGRVPRLRCPFYVEAGGQCGIWRHRNGTCATWFCTHEHALRGQRFWELVQHLLHTIEKKLILHALVTLPLGPDALDYVLSSDATARPIDENDLNRAVNPQLYRIAWGNYFGREAQFFVECAELVAPLSWQDVLAIGGSDVALLARLVRERFLEQSRAPERVRAGNLRGQLIAPDTVRVTALPRSYDQIDVPASALRRLPRLDDEEGRPLDPALVQRLLDFELLVPDDDAP